MDGFCDASFGVYEAIVYLKSVSDSVTIILILAKTKVTPVKKISVQKLELCRALLLAESQCH